MEKLLDGFLNIAKRDSKAELECKLLAGKIKTKKVADRILTAITSLSIGPPVESAMLRVMYKDDIRVEVESPQYIQKICATNTFKGIPLIVQRKGPYHREGVQKDTIDVPDVYSRFTLRMEETIRKDWDASPSGPQTEFIRLLNRRSYKTIDEFFQIDFSMVRFRKTKQQTLRDILKEPHEYELEIEFIKRDTELKSEDIAKSLFKLIRTILQAYQESEFILGPADQERYTQEFRLSKMVFYSPVTIERRHLNPERPHNILSGYTVTNKADGERWGLYVARDKKVLRVAFRTFQVVWTGLTALDDSFAGNFADGEYIPDKNLFCIFDMYRYKGRDIQSLPLMKTDDDTLKNPLNSRLGCAISFINDLKTKFGTEATHNPLRVETKLFLAADGVSMENAIKQMLTTEFEYQTDGLVFTPRLSPVAPSADRDKNTWKRVYKWKPPHQNSIDFLLKLTENITYDPVLDTNVKKGELYISRSSDDVIVYPCQTLTGEYVPRKLPAELQKLTETNTRIPALFQPASPRDPDAYQIMVPVNDKGVTHDEEGNRVDDNTIVECSYEVETRRWKVMRTRDDKTYAYRVLRQPNYGNDRQVADSIWTSIHVPVPESMIANCVSSPVDDSMEDEMYYKEDLNRTSRALQDSYKFHNQIKDSLFEKHTHTEDTLIDFGVGVGGDMLKWKRAKLSKVVGIEPVGKNLKQACTRYLKDKHDNPTDYRPVVLYVQGDMTQPLYEQESDYFKILRGDENGSTKYLENFNKLKKFTVGSAQFTMHYACESEETFRVFVKNVTDHCEDLFFGTCPDGQSVYSLLAGKKTHIFTNGKVVGGEYTKEYDDKQTWTEEFGMPIKVTLESFESKREFLVPFAKVTEMFKEEGFELIETALFSELYANQTKSSLSAEQQAFSFLNRTFVFKRGAKPKKEEPVVPTEEKVKKTRKLNKLGTEEEPVLFYGAGEDKGPYRAFSNMAEYPIQVNDVRYPTVEHYFQGQKAHEFGDSEIEEKMKKTPSGKAVKALGKKVKNFVKEVWDEKRLEVMMRGVKAKFVQHPELQKQLLDTGSKQIGEANARDSFWGIGTSENTEVSKKPSAWKGQNRLGKILMALRDEFRS
jgi:ribA/ribD-fused uncharacterized protein